MANTVNISINVNPSDKSNATERKPYDNRKVKQGEVLVPMMVDDTFLKLMPDVDPSNLRTWHMAGRTYRVAFYPVQVEFAALAMQQFYYNLNEFLGERRDARCFIPQPDGSYKICPKKSGDNRPDCAHCEHHGEYEREKKTHISLDLLMNEYEYEPVQTTDDTDPINLKMTYEDLLDFLSDKPRTKDIVSLGFSIGSKGGNLATGDYQELVKIVMEKYGCGKSRAYQIVKEALQEVEKYLYN